MNKTAIYAIMLAALFPLAAYFLVKSFSEKVAVMPRHYLPDSIISKVEGGKLKTDTLWHKLKPITLTNQEGKTITWDSLKGKVIVADFFFTHCPTICPAMTENMRTLSNSVHSGKRVGDSLNKKVHFLSISIDPERDSVERLKYWADRFQVDPAKWWLLTGDKREIYDLAINELKLHTVDGKEIDTSFVHSNRFVLIDAKRNVRGYYNGLDTVSLGHLSNDLVLLTLEKDPDKKSFFAGKLQFIAVVVLIAMILIGMFLFIFQKKRANAATSLEKK